MEIKNKYEENGYLITEYTNGTITQEIIPTNIIEEIAFEETQSPTDIEKMQVQLEYVTCLLELQNGI